MFTELWLRMQSERNASKSYCSMAATCAASVPYDVTKRSDEHFVTWLKPGGGALLCEGGGVGHCSVKGVVHCSVKEVVHTLEDIFNLLHRIYVIVLNDNKTDMCLKKPFLDHNQFCKC